jgi:UDPglucose 6-dehydrogenase
MALERISVIGLGKLGAPMAACFAVRGFDVIGVDVDEAKVDAINTGRAPVFEPRLQEVIDRTEGRLRASTDIADAVAGSDATFIVVATPSDQEGGFSLRYVLPACELIGQALSEKPGFHLVVLTSTVMPGSTASEVRAALEEASGKRCGVDFGLCYSPEFIALGSVVTDFLNPDFLLVGESDSHSGELLAEIYGTTCENDAPIARMNFVNAELAKLSVNAYVTTKITFANMLARICERLPDANVDTVAGALGLDSRIGAKYLRGAISFGGPCFPRDNVALAALARSLDAPALVSEATDRANRQGIVELADLVQSKGASGPVCILGLSYKPHTDVVDESPGVLLARELADRGISVVAHDPAATENARVALSGVSVRFEDSVGGAASEAAVVVVTTPWPQFRELGAVLTGDGAGQIVVDCWRFLDRSLIPQAIEYVPLGVASDGALAAARS